MRKSTLSAATGCIRGSAITLTRLAKPFCYIRQQDLLTATAGHAVVRLSFRVVADLQGSTSDHEAAASASAMVT